MTGSNIDLSKTKEPSRSPFTSSKNEAHYLERGSEYPDLVYSAHPDSVQEGFEYLYTARSFLRPSMGEQSTNANPKRRMDMPIQAKGNIIKIRSDIQKGLSPNAGLLRATRTPINMIEKKGGVLRKLYFEQGEWIDSVLYSILREEWKKPKIFTYN